MLAVLPLILTILDAVGMVANEKVQIVNNNNGARFETYIIPGERGQELFV